MHLLSILADLTSSNLAGKTNISTFMNQAIPISRIASITKTFAIFFQTVAFPLVVYGLAKQLVASGRNNSSGLWAVCRACIAVACIASASWFVAIANSLVSTAMKTEYTFADQNAHSGNPTYTLQPKYDDLYNKIAFLGSNGKINGTTPTENNGAAYNPVTWIKGIGNFITSTADKFSPEYWVAVLITWAMVIIGALAILIMQTLLLLQQAIILISTCILPVFIAFVAIGGSQAGIGVAFIRSVWGVLCWPIGWGIVNIGALAALQTLDATPTGGVMAAFALLLQFSLIGLWIIFGTVMVPFSIQRAVTHGANAVSRMVMGAAGVAGAGGAAIGGKIGGMIGGIAGGGGGKGAMMGGAKGALVGGLAGGPVGALAGGMGGALVGAIPMGGSGNGKAAGSALGSAPGKLMTMSTKAAEQIE